MITPAHLRRRLRAELVVTMVQLEQLCPGWWPTLTAMAEQLGTDRSSLNETLQKLSRLGLIGRHSTLGAGGTWLWWVKRQSGERMPAAPCWEVRDLQSDGVVRVRLGQQRRWAADRGIPYQTVRGFLAGNQTLLRGRWRLIKTPMDQVAIDAAVSTAAP